MPEIRHIACGESGSTEIRHTARGVWQDLSLAVEGHDAERGFSPALGWSHYRALMAVDNRAERLFYEIEAEKEDWSVEHLQRQIHTLLFARLLKSRDKTGLLELAREGQSIRKPTDVLKDPYVLDFLDLPDGERLRESDLEAAIIGQLQAFLLELGKGFAFVARQRRLAYEDEHFYVDLVFYNTILKCYLLIDLKIGKLTHQDIGQMNSYVRLFDDQFTTEGDNPTIGLILCAEKNEAVARYSVLNESQQIFAAKYLKVLPSEAELKREIERERRLIEMRRPPKEKP
jgi:predicted nuclease of restriction endonuclease-like (RecB) superfamily